MTSTEAVEVVHGMMAAREREEAMAAAAAPKYDADAARRSFWKELAGVVLGVVCALTFTALMAVLQ